MGKCCKKRNCQVEAEAKMTYNNTLDSFSSMKHQVKVADKDSVLVQKVIEVLQQKYKVVVYETPEPEAHE